MTTPHQHSVIAGQHNCMLCGMDVREIREEHRHHTTLRALKRLTSAIEKLEKKL